MNKSARTELTRRSLQIERLEDRRLLAATLTRAGQYVDMNLGDFAIRFDTQAGGTPSAWTSNGTPITNPFPGEGVTLMYDQGNDPTQGSANGLTPNPIARLDGQQLSFSYYARETEFNPADRPLGSVRYSVAGFAPFFWISHEAPDDAVPTESDVRWDTLYDYPIGDPSRTNAILDRFDAGALNDLPDGVPIFYVADGSTPDGAVLFVGDDVKTTGPWNTRLAEMREGRVAAKVRVNLGAASSDAVASLMFRREVPAVAGTDETAAFKSPGYFLNVNKSGEVQITRVGTQDTPPGPPVWTAAGTPASSTVNSTGALLEIRTRNQDDTVEVWVDNIKVGEYTDPNVIRGPHFGLFAQSTSGEIKFSERQVFDVGTKLNAIYTGYENGHLETDIKIENAGGVVTPNQIYFAQMPSAWLANNLRGAAVARAYDATGEPVVVPPPGGPAIAYGILRNDSGILPEAYALWLGEDGSGLGLYAVPQLAKLNGEPADAPHAQIDINNQGRYAISLNPLEQLVPFPPTSQSARTAVSSAQLVTHWRPKWQGIAPLQVSIADAAIVEGAGGQHSLAFDVTLNKMPTQIVRVDYQTSGDTATTNVDYTAQSGTLEFDPAALDGTATSQQIVVPILGDTRDEFDEQFFVNLTNPYNAALGASTATGTIQDDDPNVVVSLANAPQLTEGDAGTQEMVFDVSVSAIHEKNFRVEYEVAGITATEGSDYSLGPARFIDFVPGQTTHQIKVHVLGDTDPEPDETLQIQLTRIPAGRADFDSTPAVGAIIDNDTLADLADFDSDTDVDGGDFLSWQRGFGITNNAAKADGDADNNGAVDAADLAVWQQQYSTPPGLATNLVALVSHVLAAELAAARLSNTAGDHFVRELTEGTSHDPVFQSMPPHASRPSFRSDSVSSYRPLDLTGDNREVLERAFETYDQRGRLRASLSHFSLEADV